MRLPAFQFYPGDWLRDSVSGCSLAAQGLWLRLMILMHDAERYGYLAINGSAIPPDQLARRCGCSLAEFESLFAELESAGVPRRTKDGIIFSKRMSEDAEERAKNAERQRRHYDKTKTAANDKPNAKPNGGLTATSRKPNSPSSSSVSSSTNTHTPRARDDLPFTDEEFPEFQADSSIAEAVCKVAAVDLVDCGERGMADIAWTIERLKQKEKGKGEREIVGLVCEFGVWFGKRGFPDPTPTIRQIAKDWERFKREGKASQNGKRKFVPAP